MSLRTRLARPFRAAVLALALAAPAAAAARAASPPAAGEPPLTPRQQFVQDYRKFGLGASTSFPFSRLGDEQDTGFGLHALADLPLLAVVHATADIGWNRFPGADGNPAVDIWSLAAGFRAQLAWLFMSGEVAYVTEVDQVSFRPGFGLRFPRFEFGVLYTAVGKDAWTTLRAGYYF